MFNTKSKFHKGSSVLVSALVTAAASTLIGYGLTKMISTGIDAIRNQEVKMQGQQYAASRINVLRSVRFDSLSPMAKRQINDTDYYEEVVESDSTADRKNYAVNIYKGSDSVKPVAVMNLSRTATGALLDNQGADSYDSLGAGGNADSSALNTSALKNYTNDKFSADSESFATDRAMDVKSFVSYVDGMLSKYRFRSNAVTVGQNGAGTRQNPIYVSASDFECVPGSVTYAMTGNSHGYLATLTPAGNGLYYVDYTEKDVPDETTGGGTGGGSTGGNTEVKPPVVSKVERGKLLAKITSPESITFTVPEGCDCVSLNSFWSSYSSFDVEDDSSFAIQVMTISKINVQPGKTYQIPCVGFPNTIYLENTPNDFVVKYIEQDGEEDVYLQSDMPTGWDVEGLGIVPAPRAIANYNMGNGSGIVHLTATYLYEIYTDHKDKETYMGAEALKFYNDALEVAKDWGFDNLSEVAWKDDNIEFLRSKFAKDESKLIW